MTDDPFRDPVRTLPPDGSGVVDVTREHGERGGSRETLRILTVPGDESQTQVFNRGRDIVQCAMACLAVVACAVFVVGVAWRALFATTSNDRWTGLAGIVFFGVCGFGCMPPPRRRDD